MANGHSNSQLDVHGNNWLEVVRGHVESLRFGTVEVIVQDGRVIQIDKTERLRFGKVSGGSEAGSSPAPKQ